MTQRYNLCTKSQRKASTYIFLSLKETKCNEGGKQVKTKKILEKKKKEKKQKQFKQNMKDIYK